MSDRAALLAAIRQFPDNDAPRLIFADWLDEHGEGERAEFIRVQCDLALRKARYDAGERPGLAIPGIAVGRPARAGEPHYAFANPDGAVRGLLARWGALWGENWWIWSNMSGRFDPIPWRGFVCDIRCSAADWLARADAILAEHPVRRVRLTTHLSIERAYMLPQEDGTTRMWIEFGAGDVRRGYDLVTDKPVPHGATAGEIAHCLSYMAHGIAWPGIEFELPPGGQLMPNAAGNGWDFAPADFTPIFPTGTNAGGGE